MAERPVHLDPMSPLRLLERTLRVFPQKTAVVYGETRWSYERFGQEVVLGAPLLCCEHRELLANGRIEISRDRLFPPPAGGLSVLPLSL